MTLDLLRSEKKKKKSESLLIHLTEAAVRFAFFIQIIRLFILTKTIYIATHRSSLMTAFYVRCAVSSIQFTYRRSLKTIGVTFKM